MNPDQVAQAIRELSENLSKQDDSMLHSLPFWGIAVPALIGIITFFIEYLFSKKKFKQEVTMNCIDRYREIFKAGHAVNAENVHSYLGFINEELFYFQKKLVYKKLREEWLQNMINTLPILYEKDGEYKVLNQKLLKVTRSFFHDSENWNYLLPYPTIRKTILIDIEDIHTEFKVSTELAEAYKNMEHNSVLKKQIVRKMIKKLNR